MHFRAFDVISYLEQRQIPFSETGKNIASGWIGLTCPFPYCSDASTHFGINLTSKIFKCWICGTKGNPVALVKAFEQCSWSKAKEIVEEFTDWSIVKDEVIQERAKATFVLPPEFTLITPDTIPISVQNYLTDRNFDPVKTATKFFPLYYAGFTGKYKFRLIIPVYHENRIVNFLGRSISKNAPLPYRNCPNDQAEIPINSLLYGYDELPVGASCVLVEGVFDKWRMGFGALATFGLEFTIEQADLLRKKRPKKVFILDDPGAEQAADKTASKISFAPSEVIDLFGSRDPAEFTPQEATELMRDLLG
jgi:DNA primase